MLDENDLINGVLNGDESAFKMLYSKYVDIVFNTSLNLLQHKQEAEDNTQEVFIEIYKSIGKFKQEASLKTWVYKITLNKCYDHLKKQKSKKRFAFVTSLFNSENELIHDSPHFNHPGIALENKEHAAALFFAIKQIPQNQQTAFTLSKIEGLSNQEIAAIMNNSVSSVVALLFRANKNLKTSLYSYYKNNLQHGASIPKILLLML